MAANLEEKTISKSKETFQKEVEGLKKKSSKIISEGIWVGWNTLPWDRENESWSVSRRRRSMRAKLRWTMSSGQQSRTSGSSADGRASWDMKTWISRYMTYVQSLRRRRKENDDEIENKSDEDRSSDKGLGIGLIIVLRQSFCSFCD